MWGLIPRARSETSFADPYTLSLNDHPAEELVPNANVNSVENGSRTPLSWAATGGHKEVIKVLLSHGADQTIKNNFGAAPIMFAASRAYRSFVRFTQQGPSCTNHVQ